jgi:outer membrane immunogenic protein
VEPQGGYTPAASTWTGFYVGASVGFAGDEFNYPVSATDAFGNLVGSGSAHLNSSGVIGGGQAGFNFQFSGPFVAGVEADIQASSVTGEIGLNGQVAGTPFAGTAGSRLGYLGTIRGRLGYAVLANRGLVYATGGLAYGGVNSFANGSISGTGLGISKDTTGTGWTIGGGFEYALNDHWSFRTEYLFVDLGSAPIYNGPLLGVPNVNLGVDTKASVFRAGVDYKFGGPEPVVVAKY